MIQSIFWDCVSTEWRPNPVLSLRQVHAVWPSPVDADACFQKAGFTDFADTDDEWDTVRLVWELDERVPRDGSWIEFSQYGGGPDESTISGNRRGYQRLGIEFLKAILDSDAAESIHVDLDYLVVSNSTVGFDWFELSDSPMDIPAAPHWHHWLILFGCLFRYLTEAASPPRGP